MYLSLVNQLSVNIQQKHTLLPIVK